MIGQLDWVLLGPRVLGDVVRRSRTPPWDALFRIVAGFILIPFAGWWQGSDEADWRLFPFFLLVLLMLRVVPALVRHLLPFSRELQARWASQRFLAKRCDSYQWRKLFWFGLGMAGYVGLLGRARGVEGLLAITCLLAGGAGELAWRRVRQTDQVSQFLPK